MVIHLKTTHCDESGRTETSETSSSMLIITWWDGNSCERVVLGAAVERGSNQVFNEHVLCRAQLDKLS